MNQPHFPFLFRHSVPAFGQWATWVLLLLALSLAVLPFEPVEGLRMERPATIFSLLPASLLAATWFYEVVRWLLIFSAIAWMFHRTIPLTCWSTCFSFALLWSLRIENSDEGSNIYSLTNLLLFVHAMWFQFYHPAMRDAKKNRVYRTTLLYPRWVFLLSLVCIGLFHTVAGFSKVWHSGFDWSNGLSLQLWVQLFGREGSPVADLITSNRTVATFLQTSALMIASSSIVVLFNRWLRLLVGVLLLVVYVGAIITFVDFGFQIDALIVALFLLPFESRLNGSPGQSASGLSEERSNALSNK